MPKTCSEIEDLLLSFFGRECARRTCNGTALLAVCAFPRERAVDGWPIPQPSRLMPQLVSISQLAEIIAMNCAENHDCPRFGQHHARAIMTDKIINPNGLKDAVLEAMARAYKRHGYEQCCADGLAAAREVLYRSLKADGWVIVRVGATEKMTGCGLEQWRPYERFDPKAVWAEMCAASPKPERWPE